MTLNYMLLDVDRLRNNYTEFSIKANRRLPDAMFAGLARCKRQLPELCMDSGTTNGSANV